MSGKSNFRVDTTKNRLYITLSGFFRDRDVEPVLEDLKVALRDLKPEFDVVTDLTKFVPGSPAATDALTRGGELVAQHRRRHGVRVTGGLMTGLMQFQRMLKNTFDHSNTRYAKSVAEANAMLDNWEDES